MALDIEVCTIAKGKLQLHGVDFPVPANILLTANLQFGLLSVPGPRDVESALFAFGFSDRMYRNAGGRLFSVPASVPDRALPSDRVCPGMESPAVSAGVATARRLRNRSRHSSQQA